MGASCEALRADGEGLHARHPPGAPLRAGRGGGGRHDLGRAGWRPRAADDRSVRSDAAEVVRIRRPRSARAGLSRRRSRVRRAAARRGERASGARAGPVPCRHQALRQSAPLPGRPRVALVRAEDKADHARAQVTSLIFSTPSYDYLARDLARGGGFDCGEVQRDLFPDGEHYLRLCTPVSDRHVVVVGGTISDAATLEIYDLACAVVENGCATLTLVVPWYGYATQDRAVKSGEAVTAKTRARLLSSIPPAKLANEILLLDLHSEGIPHYFEGTIHPRHVYGKPVMEELARELGGQEFVVGSTDAGRAKWG